MTTTQNLGRADVAPLTVDPAGPHPAPRPARRFRHRVTRAALRDRHTAVTAGLAALTDTTPIPVQRAAWDALADAATEPRHVTR